MNIYTIIVETRNDDKAAFRERFAITLLERSAEEAFDNAVTRVQTLLDDRDNHWSISDSYVCDTAIVELSNAP